MGWFNRVCSLARALARKTVGVPHVEEGFNINKLFQPLEEQQQFLDMVNGTRGGAAFQLQSLGHDWQFGMVWVVSDHLIAVFSS